MLQYEQEAGTHDRPAIPSTEYPALSFSLSFASSWCRDFVTSFLASLLLRLTTHVSCLSHTKVPNWPTFAIRAVSLRWLAEMPRQDRVWSCYYCDATKVQPPANHHSPV